MGDHAYRASAVETALAGSDGSSGSIAAAAAHATDGVTVSSDIHADRDYRTAMAAVYTRRAIEAALARLRLIARRRRVQVQRVTPGRRAPARLVGAILARDLTVSGARWSKGRRLSADDLVALAAADAGDPVTVLVPEAGRAPRGRRRAAPRGGRGRARADRPRPDRRAGSTSSPRPTASSTSGSPTSSALNRIDPLEVFTAFDGQVVARGDLVASVKVAPHLVEAATVDAGARLAGFGSHPLVWVAPFIAEPGRRASSRSRSAATARATVRGQRPGQDRGPRLDDRVDRLRRGRPRRGRGRDGRLRAAAGPGRPDPDRRRGEHGSARPVLPGDRRARRPHRPARASRPTRARCSGWPASASTAILGLPTCGAYSKATAADLLLPRLLSGEGATERTVAKLGHGGILTRSQRFRFPAYARELDAPDG